MRYNPTWKNAGLTAWVLALLAGTPAPAADPTIRFGDHPFPGPVSVKTDQPLDPKVPYVLVSGDVTIPAQVDAEGRLVWYQPRPCGADGCAYRLEQRPSAEGAGVQVEKEKEGLLAVTIDGKPFTWFNYGPDLPKPFLYPVIGPTGAAVTRDYPMKDTDAEKSKKRQDHPHHRSIWTAHGDVRLGHAKSGTDYWAQGSDKGLQKVRRIVRTVSGPVFGEIEADIDWVTAAGKKELSETRTYRFYRAPADHRVVDIRVAFRFTEGDVTFADTKEGGIVSLRTAITMDEISGGKMVNARGQTGMKACWGKPAEWCDYVGPVDGQTVGIAVMDAKTNFRHPTTWHIRDYGLYTANPFGLKAFDRKNEDGSKTWKQGEAVAFNYRILIHKGDTGAARVAEHYQAYTAGQEPK